MTEKLIIIGSGPAGHTAAIYAARANLNPLMFEGLYAGGIAPGGQLTTTSEIENFPGFSNGIQGIELTDKFREQSLKFGTRIITETVNFVDLSKRPFLVKTDSSETMTESLIIATGATAKKLNIPGNDKFWQKGISACAVCDGALPCFRNKPLAVIGGGDSAIEEANHLSRFGSVVYLIHRRNELRASKIMQKKLFENSKIQVIWDSAVLEAKGDTSLKSLVIQNLLTKESKELECLGLFYAIGHNPNTSFLNNQLDLDSVGYIITKSKSTKTSIDGVFACGDVQDSVYRQAITAAGTGCMAALEVEKFLTENT